MQSFETAKRMIVSKENSVCDENSKNPEKSAKRGVLNGNPFAKNEKLRQFSLLYVCCSNGFARIF
jgi:hypothetical protein